MSDARLARGWLWMTPAERPPGTWTCGRCHEATELYMDCTAPRSVCCDSPYLRFHALPAAEVRVQGKAVPRPAVVAAWFLAMRQAVDGVLTK